MAIKPNDCVIKFKDLVVGTKKVTDPYNGRSVEVVRYEQYWEKFQTHVEKLAKNVKQTRWDQSPYDIIEEQELGKYGGTFKQTKNWDDRYIKFKSHAHLTMFVLKFS